MANVKVLCKQTEEKLDAPNLSMQGHGKRVVCFYVIAMLFSRSHYLHNQLYIRNEKRLSINAGA